MRDYGISDCVVGAHKREVLQSGYVTSNISAVRHTE